MTVATLIGTPDPDPRPSLQLVPATTVAAGAAYTLTVEGERVIDSTSPAYVQHVLGDLTANAEHYAVDSLRRAVEDVHLQQHDRHAVRFCSHALCRAATAIGAG
jgi:hypothetical protein